MTDAGSESFSVSLAPRGGVRFFLRARLAVALATAKAVRDSLSEIVCGNGRKVGALDVRGHDLPLLGICLVWSNDVGRRSMLFES